MILFPRPYERPEQSSNTFRIFKYRCMSEFPEISQIKNAEVLDFEGNHIRSFQTLPKLHNLRRLLLDRTKITSFNHCIPQPNLQSISLLYTPLSYYKYLSIMCSIVFGPRLKKVNGKEITEEEIKFVNENRQKILPFLQEGYLLTDIDPVIKVIHNKTKEVRVIDSQALIGHVDSIAYNKATALNKEEEDNKRETSDQGRSKSTPKQKKRRPPPPIETTCFGVEADAEKIRRSKQRKDKKRGIKTPPSTPNLLRPTKDAFLDVKKDQKVLKKVKSYYSPIRHEPLIEDSFLFSPTKPKENTKIDEIKFNFSESKEMHSLSYSGDDKYQPKNEKQTKDVTDYCPSLTSEITNEKNMKSPKHRKPPKLAFDPPPLTDDSINFTDIVTKEKALDAFYRANSNKITTPEEAELFLGKVMKKNRKNKKTKKQKLDE